MAKITWGIDDGYVGPDAPQYVIVPDDEIADCDSLEDVEDLIDTYVREAFETTIHTYWDRSQMDDLVYGPSARDEEE